MARPKPIDYAQASAEVRAVYDDIKATRGVADVNNFWKRMVHGRTANLSMQESWPAQR